jgi:hypothetical protein
MPSYLEVFPERLDAKMMLDVGAQEGRESVHERGAWGDAVWVKVVAVGKLNVASLLLQRVEALAQKSLLAAGVVRCVEAAGALLVHLCARSNSVDRHVQQSASLWASLAEQAHVLRSAEHPKRHL